MTKKLQLLAMFIIMSIFVNAQSITLTSPNGGQVWAGCTIQSITWNATGTSNNYTIDYSTDGGSNWVSVTSSLYVTNGTYSWTVPNISSTNCLIKIYDSNTSSTVDISDATFTITAPLILISPNGTETWQGGTTQSITWVASGTTNYYNIYYSTNAGSNWTSIVTNYYTTSQSYSWAVPNSPSSQCLIKINDYTNSSCMVDESNNLFTITPATPIITVTSPNSTQTWYVGESKTITWTSQYVTSGLVKIDYSIDNGSNWIPVSTSTDNDGSFAWTVPNTPSANCLVKITDLGVPTTYDISNSVFTIADPFITITAPNGTETWNGCSSQTISWSKGGTSYYYKIEYSTDNGSNWNTINSSYYTTSSSPSYTWSPVPSLSSTNCLVKVTDVNNLSATDVSNAVFNLTTNIDIIITSPDGGQNWQAGSTQTITWVSAPTSTRFAVYYSTDNGSNWTVITSSTYSTSQAWTIPNAPSAICLIKVVDYYSSCIYDVSDATFTITPPTPIITVTAPNSAQTLYFANSTNITWTSAYLTSSYVNIDYSIDNGSNWLEVATVTENDGTFAWTVPSTASAQCLVRVSEYNNPTVNDVSNTTFTIAPPYITVTAPNGGQSWDGCSSQTISWIKGGTSYYYKIEYSTDSGTTWNTISSSYYTTSSSPSYTWNPVTSISSSNCLIKISDANLLTTTDISNAVFTLIKNSDIVITTPNGGQSWEVGTSQTITWVAEPTSTRFAVYYSTDNGSNWTVITSSTYSTSQAWTIPNAPSAICLIKVVDYYSSCIFDVSDATFTITPPTPIITVTAPNSAQTLYFANSTNITWTSAYLTSSFVAIEYSVDNGSNWLEVANVTENDGIFAWTIPSTASAQCLVRVSEYNNPSVNDVSNTTFTIAPAYITVTAPNGGQSWDGCSSQTISWIKGGTSYYYKIEYSTDSGTTWNTISSSYYTTSSSPSYTWNPVTSISSSNCLIKVSDANLLTTTDISNAVFTLVKNSDIVVTTPNGGQSWEVGTSQTITWVAEPTSTRFAVYYSTDNGSNWIVITSSTYSTSQAWTIPNAPSAICLIKVVDYYSSCIFDINDANFTITPPTPIITVTAPNSAQTLYFANSTNITWTSAYLTSSFVAIEYSIDNGSTWIEITNVTENDGIFAWTVPSTASAQCLVRISEYNNPSVNDVSNTTFTIAPPYITVTAPNGGQNWDGCSSQTISWIKGGTSYYYKIEYSTDSGTTWNTISSSYYTTSSSPSYTWNPVTSISSSNCLIKVSDANLLTTIDISNAVFTLTKNSDIVITTPNGGQSWEVGTSQTITWVAEPTSTRFAVYYSTDNGSNWTVITSSTYSTSQAWTIPNAPSAICLIKVVDYYSSCIFDVSDATFTITPPTPIITVTAPNSAQTLYFANSTNITWTSAYLTSSFVAIEYSIDNGSNWLEVANVTENDGTFAWTVPSTASAQCLVKVSEYNNPTVNDVSNTTFTIAPPYITVTAPNGGQNWDGCSSQTISWIKGGTSYYYKIEYSTDNGTTWNTINNSYYTTSSSPSYTWNPIANISSTNCLIKISDANLLTTTDISNAIFSVTGNDDIIVTSPNNGENWQVGTTQTITWVSSPSSTHYAIYYSIDNGSNWVVINSSSYSTSQSWTIPNSPSSNCLIKVVDYSNSCVYDLSDAAFTITPGTPQVTSPNGGETRYYASSYNITWTNSYYNSTYVTIELSVDSGATWTSIAAVTNNTGSYSWTVPNNYSTKCLVKVSEYNNATVYDISDNVFTIAPALVVTSPNGDNGTDTWRVCTQTSIQWTTGGTTNYFNIEYSINNGSSWTSIVSNYYTTGTTHTYDWTIPNTPSTLCLIRVTDASSSAKTDLSNATFTITPSITITSPNGGQSWMGGEVHDITWDAISSSNYFNIDYSTNGGGAWTNIIFNQNITNGTYSWTVPSATSTNCLIKITDYNNTCKTDISDNTFSIGLPSPVISITSPNGSETLSGCVSENIIWSASSTSDYYTIEYSTNNGSSWLTIISNYYTLSGNYAWNVPNISSSDCKIRVKDFNNSSISDISDVVFTINQSVTASITPSGATTFCAGGSVILTSSSATNNVWSPGGQTTQAITVSTTGNYSVTVSNAGCSAISESVSVMVNAIPSAPVASSNSPVPLNGTLQLTASTIPYSSYSWSGPNSFSSALQNPTISNATSSLNGTYSVIANVNGCQSVASNVTVTVSGTPASVIISGAVKTENGNFVNGVTLDMTGDATDSEITGVSGQYSFNMLEGGSYAITPSKSNDINKVNGISTLDIVLIQRHILNVQSLSSAYKVIAADVNQSSSVTNMDILLLQSLILQSSTSLPSGSWRFVNSDYSFADPLNPFPYENNRAYSSAENASGQDFIAVKLGDVNGSWNSNIAKSINSQELNFSMDNKQAVNGEIITIPVKVSNFNNISGYQFTINWNPAVLEFQNVANAIQGSCYGTNNVSSGSLTTLWATEQLNGESFEDNTTVFEISFRVVGNNGSNSAIEINSSFTNSEAYNSNLEEITVSAANAIVSINETTSVNLANSNGYSLNQNVPNPFSNITEISFELPVNETVRLQIFDVVGREIMNFSGNYPAGTNKINWNGKDEQGISLNDGTYYIRMKTGSYVNTKKMVLIK